MESAGCPPDVLDEFALAVEAALMSGRLAEAAGRLEALPPPEGWRHPRAQVQASRIIGWLGGPRRRLALLSRAWRESRGRDLEILLPRLFHLEALRGPLAALEFVWQHTLPETASAMVRANWLAAHSGLQAQFRDGEQAEQLWAQALAVAEPDAWRWVDRSRALVALDRLEEAVEAVQSARALSPDYAPAVMQAAGLQTLIGEDEAALALLAEAYARAPYASYLEMRAAVLLELDRPREALEAIERLPAESPYLERAEREGRTRQRSYAHYRLGEWEAAAQAASEAGHEWHTRFADRLRVAPPAAGHRLVWPVAYLRQRVRTCGPATMAGLLRYFGRPVAQDEIARQIWYEGTFDVDERRWAEAAGCVVREFRLDSASGRALLAAGIPFALSTRQAGSAHLQAVIGFDTFRESWILRDPYDRGFTEVMAAEFLQRQAAHGPRAMALVPVEREELVAKLRAADLSEAAAYDAIYRLRLALQRHERTEAGREAEALEVAEPGSRLAWQARRELAAYDGAEAEELAAVEALLRQFPDDGTLRVAKLGLLLQLAREPEAAAWVEVCGAERWSESKDVSGLVIFWRRKAEELAADARQHVEARRWQRLLLRFQPLEERVLQAYGELLWTAGQREESVRLLRLAACRSGAGEGTWRALFAALRVLGREPEMLTLLEARFARLGDASADPALTLAWARRERGELAAADAVLEAGLARRPDDGVLLLHMAETCARDGRIERARELLERAREKSRPADWLRGAAQVAGCAGALTEALGHWRALVQIQPLAASAQEAVARLLAETDPAGPPVALAWLDEQVRRFPHSLPLLSCRYEWHRGHSPADVAEAALRDLLAAHPRNAWAWRELALLLAHGTRGAEALAAAEQAAEIEPHFAASALVRSSVLLALGRPAEAAEAARRAVRLNVEHPTALRSLLECVAREQMAETLEWLGERVLAESRGGDAVLAFREAALPHWSPERLLEFARQAQARRPELWQSWLVLAQQQAALGKPAEARALLRQATERFDRNPRLWVELAEVEQELGETAAQIESLRRSLALSPHYAYASRVLCLTLLAQGRSEEARAVLEQAIALAPLDPQNLLVRSNFEWGAGATDATIASLERALQLEPGLDAAWSQLTECSRRLGVPHDQRVARALAEARPGETRSWLLLAEVLRAPGERTEALAALERALALSPRSQVGHDHKVRLLAEDGRFDEALAAAAPTVFGPTTPLPLRGRAAWVRAQRGDLAGARQAMQALVEEDPGYHWGWERLAEWAERMGDHAAVQAAAAQLARLEGDEPMALAYRADARLAQGDRAGAKEDLRQALRLRPSYDWALLRLQELEVEDGALEAAAALQEQLGQLRGGDDFRTLVGAIRLGCARGDFPAVEAVFRTLVRQPAAATVPIGPAVRMIVERWGAKQAGQLCADGCRLEGVHPGCAAAWAEVRWRNAPLTAQFEIGPLTRTALGTDILAESLRGLGERRSRVHLWLLTQRFRQQLESGTETWGQAVYALVHTGAPRAALRWAEGWRRYPNAEPWMLYNAALAYRLVGRGAPEIHEAALARVADRSTAEHWRWLAFERALARKPAAAQEAQQEWQQRRPEEARDEMQDEYTRLLLAAWSAVPAEAGNVHKDVFSRILRLHEGYCVRADWDLAQALAGWRALTVLAQASGRPWLRLRARWAKPIRAFSGKLWTGALLLPLLLLLLQALRAWQGW
ncbi:MAG: tetratricopeptide repeat protein [Verrucomicrobia bacterium]|nr:tetratricopeptide repeat protein [Verrucomicrobiota bacterium]